jgi:CRP-like cAMP-binding protein
MHSTADSGTHNGPLSSALATIFRGKLCGVVLQNRSAATFEKGQVIYDVRDENQTLFFLKKGFVKVGSITEDGHELIYDVRKAGDIVGGLCASGLQRQDRAVALERTEVIAVPLDEVLDIVQKNRDLLQELVQTCCQSLSDAYDQLNTLAFSDTVHRLVRVLLRLGTQLGHSSGQRTELCSHRTEGLWRFTESGWICLWREPRSAESHRPACLARCAWSLRVACRYLLVTFRLL